MRALGLIALACVVASCGVEELWSSGEVYTCDVGVELELCWPNGASSLSEDLAKQYGLASVPCSRSTRAVTLLGCQYSCPPPMHGCNAHMGCYCPTPDGGSP